MAGQWLDIPIGEKLYQNVSETELTRAQAAMENCFVTEAEGLRRFYGIDPWLTLPNEGRVYVFGDRHFNLIAVTDRGNVYRIDEEANFDNVTGVPVQGGKRPIQSDTPDGVMIAAGGPLIRLGKAKTDILSEDAPNASHVQFIDNFVLVNDEGRFQHSNAGDFTTWDPLDVFAVNSKPDFITAMLVTPFSEIMLAGAQSVEQYERLTGGATAAPFFRRWPVGEGVSAPYTMLHADNALFFVNHRNEFVRSSGQTSQPVSVDIGAVLQQPGLDWSEAWVGGFPDRPLSFDGQFFILLQLPHATNPYGTKGLTFVYDYRAKRWFTLYGWDADLGVPTRWPGWSHWPLWGEVFIGADAGRIGKLSKTVHTNFGETQRMLSRTAHLSKAGELEIDDLRMHLRRGVGSYTTEPVLRLRCQRDNRGFGRWITKGLGLTGDRQMTIHFGPMGIGHSFQWEIEITDDAVVEIHRLEAQGANVGR